MPSLSDLHFRIGAIEIFSYGYFEYRTFCSWLKLEGLMACLHRNLVSVQMNLRILILFFDDIKELYLHSSFIIAILSLLAS